MSASEYYEPTARQIYGPPPSSEHLYESTLEHKLTGNMNVQSVKTPVLRGLPISPSQEPEPDSTNPESITQSVTINKPDKEVEYHITENKCNDTEMSVDTLSSIVRFEETALGNMGHIAYPIIQETDDLTQSTYIDKAATIIPGPLNTAIVQNVAKLPQNFTFNVDATVSNITAIQNVTHDGSSNQTLWLPTILATGTPADIKSDDVNQPTGMSQIIITSESYVNDASVPGRRANIVTETNYINRPKASKVQILSNISIPKSTNYPQQFVAQSKELLTPVIATQNHVYKLSANVVPQKHLNSSVLCTKAPKTQSLIGCSPLTQAAVNHSSVKNVSYTHTFAKGSNIAKTLNKVNNGANLNAVVPPTAANMQCHILSRVVSGPNKMAVHSGRKNVNTLKGSKNAVPTIGQKNQSRSIKIIQQATNCSHKSEKSWPVSNVPYKNQHAAYTIPESKTSKIIQKIGSPTHKSQHTTLPGMQKGERLVLQSPCGPVVVSTAPICTGLPKGPHYVQSGATPSLRYVQTYGTSEHQISNISQVSANQQLTAQILESLSQPKMVLATNHSTKNLSPVISIKDEPVENQFPYQKRIVIGDKSTLLTANDTVGMEERPNISEELERYTFQSLVFVMLDHTYALPAQKQPSSTVPSTAVSTGPPTIVSCTQTTSSLNPIKTTSPIIMSTASYDMPSTVPTTVMGPHIPVSAIQMGTLNYKPQPLPPQDDDAVSNISSLDGDRKPPDCGGSDTETAPEGEEEGKTRCICDFTHDDGYMICCDRCGEWQHVDCMGIDRQNIPDSYMCELCHPRAIDRRHARAIQMRKSEELSALGGSDSDSSEGLQIAGQRRKRLLTVTTYTNTSGSYVTTYNSTLPVLPPLPQPSLTLPKRGPKRPKKADIIRKGAKRKLSEKRVKRKKEMMLNKNKYNSGLSNQSHWQESYELAMTNHYSPELRAKIVKYSNKLGTTANMASAITAHHCTTVPHAGGKILIATKDLKENVPIIELRGKYMLSNQHRPQVQNCGRAGSQKPGPFVFFYRLPKDNTQICIDTRTYGNEARFVRRSCKPNAELQHCVVKGALHVYLVSIGTVQSNTEITVGHDSNGSKQPCACGNPKHCKVNGLNTILPRKSVDYPPREKRSRNRCISSSSPVSPPPALIPVTPIKEELSPKSPIKVSPIKISPIKMSPAKMSPTKMSPTKQEFSPMSPMKSALMRIDFNEDSIKSEVLNDIKPEIDLHADEEMKPDIDETDFVKCDPKLEETDEETPLNKLEYEELHIKEESAKQECEATNFEVESKVEDNIFSEEVKPEKEDTIVKKEEVKVEEEKIVVPDVVAKSACHDRSSRSSKTNLAVNQDSLDEKTDDSQDKIQTNAKEKEKRKMTREERKMEAIMKAFERMEKAEQKKQEVKERQKRRESDPHPNAVEKEDDDEVHCNAKKRRRRKGRARTTSQCNRRRLNSADSDLVTSGDEAPPSVRGTSAGLYTVTPPRHEADQSDSITEDLGLSSACLLVEAAVGSVESAFKLPKTKKTMATEWVGRSPERTPSPYHSPYRPSLVPAPSLESLVRVASTMIGDLSGGHDLDPEEETHIGLPASPPRTPTRDRSRPPKKAKRITRSTPPEPVAPSITQHSAKKRWLRQAISEESDSPIAESPPCEMVTPLKKRRLARESLSCEQNNIVPCPEETCPNFTSEDSPVKDDTVISRQYTVRNIMECIYGTRDRTRSDSGQGSDDQCNLMDNDVLNMNLKDVHDSEDIRRIIGVPMPDEPPVITKPENIKTNNNNVESEESSYNKVVPMEIDTTILPQPKLQESNENSLSYIKGIDSPTDKINSCDTSGNSSPQRDEMDDIQKKIHSFHTENIQILKSRNKKPPKEKRKKVNLNFDLNMVNDQIRIQLRTEDNSKSPETNGDIIIYDLSNSANDDVKLHVSPENIPLPPVESIPLPAPESIPLPEEPGPVVILPPPEAIPLPEEPMMPSMITNIGTVPMSPSANKLKEKVVPVEKSPVSENSTLSFSSRFNSTGLFSGIFSNISSNIQQPFELEDSIDDNLPDMSIIKSAIHRTTILDNSVYTNVDELKSVQEILTRVNNMDSNNSVLLSGVLQSSGRCGNATGQGAEGGKPAVKPFCVRANDPRLNPPPVDKPKPIRRKLSITEYRKRHKGSSAVSEEGGGGSSSGVGEGGVGCAGSEGCREESCDVPEWSSESSGGGSQSLSPQRLEAAAAAAADELEQRLHKDLVASHAPKDVFDAQPTASERQRENLSSRLRREFGLALPDEEDHPAHPARTDCGVAAVSSVASVAGVGSVGTETKRCDR